MDQGHMLDGVFCPPASNPVKTKFFYLKVNNRSLKHLQTIAIFTSINSLQPVTISSSRIEIAIYSYIYREKYKNLYFLLYILNI